MLAGSMRDEIARVLEQIAKEGLDHPRNLDAALDAIGCALEGKPMMKCVSDGQDFFIDGHDEDDAKMAFGEGTMIIKGYFVEGSE